MLSAEANQLHWVSGLKASINTTVWGFLDIPFGN